MSQQNRLALKTYFITGAKPSQSQFSDLIDSCLNMPDDGITIDNNQNIVLNQGLTLKNTTDGSIGSIRWNGTNFQFKDNTGWNDLSLGGASSQWVTSGTDINYPTGNVGIDVNSPTFKFEVELGTSMTASDTVRLGNVTIFMDGPVNAYFSHRNNANATSYALVNDIFGNVGLNSLTGSSISFSENNAVKAAITSGVLSIGSPPNTPNCLLVVNGGAANLSGSWSTVGSDERLKTDITPFRDGLSILKKFEPINYKYNGKAGISTIGQHVGLIAQHVEKVFPDMVGRFYSKLNENDKKETELLSLNVGALTYIMVNAIKELDERMIKLEKKSSKIPASNKAEKQDNYKTA